MDEIRDWYDNPIKGDWVWMLLALIVFSPFLLWELIRMRLSALALLR